MLCNFYRYIVVVPEHDSYALGDATGLVHDVARCCAVVGICLSRVGEGDAASVISRATFLPRLSYARPCCVLCHMYIYTPGGQYTSIYLFCQSL